jgi:hypothetical protein
MTLNEIKTAVAALPAAELRILARWLEERLEDRWDQQIEADVLAGRLDKVSQQAMDDFTNGRCTPLP